MKQWFVLFQKEQLELWRSLKWIWVPIIFMLLGSSTPLSTYYLPQLLESFGGLPEGTVLDIPTPTGAEILGGSLGDFGLLGVLVLILAFMSTVSGERRSGVASLILLKPVPYGSFLTAKWASAVFFTWISFGLGYGLSLYYTLVLYDAVPVTLWLASFLYYGLWLTFVMTLIVFFSTILKKNGAIAFAVILSVWLLTILSTTFSAWLTWSPAQLTTQAIHSLGDSSSGSSLPVLITTLVSIVLLQALSISIFTKKELID